MTLLNLSVEYQQASFQCFGDYNKCFIQFNISTWPKVEEMIIFDREVIPLVRETDGFEPSQS